MIYSVFKSNLLLIRGYDLASLIPRLPTLRIIASILMKKIIFIIFAFN